MSTFLTRQPSVRHAFVSAEARKGCECRFVVMVVAVLAFLSLPSVGQQPGAIPQFSTVETHEYDTINLGTLGIQLNVPIRSKAGHIPYSYRLVGTSQISFISLKSPTFGASPWLVGGEAHVPRNAVYTNFQICYDSNHEPSGVEVSGFYSTDALGTVHTFSNLIIGEGTEYACPYPQIAGAYADDNSGLYLQANYNSGNGVIFTLWDMDGNSSPGSSSLTDSNGNTISAGTDTLGETVMTGSGVGLGLKQLPSEQFTWTDALGNNQTVTGTNTEYPIYTAFGCTYDGPEGGNEYFPTSLSFPDNSTVSFTWEPSQVKSGDYTGRIASITLPTGGAISYAYSGGTKGVNCLDGTPATMTRTTPDGQWVYTHVASLTSPTTTVLAPPTANYPSGTNTVYTFVMMANGLTSATVPIETEKQVYNGSVSPGNLIETVITCYNNTSSSPTNCNASYIGAKISEKDVYTTYTGVTGYSAVKTAYDSYGRVSQVQNFDFNATTPTNIKTILYGTGSPSSQTCSTISTSAPGQYIIDKPCEVTLTDGSGNILSQTWNSYNSYGNLVQTWNLVSGSGATGTYLSKQYSYYTSSNGVPNGVVQTMTEVLLVNGANTTSGGMNYTTASCNNMFVTSQYPTGFSNLTTSQSWDCNGGVVTSSTDANSQTTHTNFYVNTTTDPFYRPLQDVDELGNITSLSYGYTSLLQNTFDSQFLFNGSASVIETLSSTDSLGRPTISQLRQGPSSTKWDTISRSFDSNGRLYSTTLECVNTASVACSASTESQTYDALNRPIVHTAPTLNGNQVITKSYSANDVLTILTPAPSDEHAKSVQKEYDGLGRLKSACLISNATGSGTCTQTTSATGFQTSYSYDGAGRLLQTVENAQGSPTQARSYTYDGVGRVTAENNPESGTTTYIYDSVTTQDNCTPSPSGRTHYGVLLRKTNPDTTYTCYTYDLLNRVTNVDSSRTNGAPCKRFSYDNSTGVLNAIPSGIKINNPMGRLVEAETDNCSAYPPTAQTMITDEWFSYSPRGELTDIWEYTVNSGVYVHLSATYWADRQINTISGLGLPTISYDVLDGEGRVQEVSNGLVSNVVYNTGNYPNQPIGALMSVTLGSGDSESFTYDPNTRWMTSYSASVGSTPTQITGNLNWNPNGTLQQLNITDGYNSLDTQTCNYLYDDFIRIASGIDGTPGVNCMNGVTKVWNQTFSYDPFGNITKSSTGPGLSWACTACYNAANNQYNNVLSPNITYDGNGNLTDDTFHTYTWFPDGHVAAIDGKNTITYDANGNKVEENIAGTIHQYVYGFGVTAQMTGSTENATTVDLPGGLQALFSGGGVQRYRYPDWQGTIRAESNPTTREFTESLAFAPFGERYAQLGYPFNVDSFTGKPDQIVPDEYDFLAREDSNPQGRWISPDPMRGTGNKYVYADNNPLSKVDIYGMYAVVVNGLEVDTEDSVLDAAAYSIAESKPQQSQQTGGQLGASPSGNGQAATTTQSPEKHQQDEQKKAQQQGQKEQEEQKEAQSKEAADKPAPQPPPTDPKTGKPTPPPVPVPGCPTCGWVWHDDKQNPRGGRWDPSGWEGPNPPNGSWDPAGHWDINGGKGEPVDHYDPKGNPITPGQAHPGNAPTAQTMMERMRSITPGPILEWGTAGVVIYIIIDEGSRLYPPRNLVPVP